MVVWKISWNEQSSALLHNDQQSWRPTCVSNEEWFTQYVLQCKYLLLLGKLWLWPLPRWLMKCTWISLIFFAEITLPTTSDTCNWMKRMCRFSLTQSECGRNYTWKVLHTTDFVDATIRIVGTLIMKVDTTIKIVGIINNTYMTPLWRNYSQFIRRAENKI